VPETVLFARDQRCGYQKPADRQKQPKPLL